MCKFPRKDRAWFSFRSLAFVLLTLTLSGCGGGGGGGGVSGFSYSGNTNRADVTLANATGLVANVLGDTATTSVVVAYRESGNATSASVNQVGFVRSLSGHLSDAISQAVSTRSSEERFAARIGVDQTDICQGGSIHLHGTIEDNGTGTLTADFNSCRDGNDTINGRATIRILAFDFGRSLISDAIYSFPTLVLTGQNYRFSLSGSIRSQVSISTNTRRLVANMVTRDDVNGGMTKSDNLVIADVFNSIYSPSTITETITGRVFDSVHGFVDIETLVPLVYSSANQFLTDSGQLLLTGSNDSSIRLTVQSLTLVWLELDLDGDTSFEIVSALSWIDLSAELELQDSDGDGMHDAWEQSNGFDPFDSGDATLDNDLDGFSSFDEYLAGTDPGDVNSVPQSADLTISVSLSGSTLAGAVASYHLVVTNTGPNTADNIIVSDPLPPGTTFVSATGFGWSCNETEGIVRCTRANLAVGTAPGITISVVLPQTPGHTSNTASVLSGTYDSHTTNNSNTLVTAIATLAPSENLDLGADVFDMEFDSVRQRLYVSIPDLNLIKIISLDTFTVTNSVVVSDSPHGIDMSPDGSTLYVALNQSGTVAVLNLDTLDLTEIVIAVELDTSKVYDVIAPVPGLVFASGNPGSSGLAYIVQIDTANGNQVSRAASSRIIRSNPFFAARSTPQFLYVGEGFSPNSVYKLDISQAGTPLVLEDHHGSIVSGSHHLDVSLDGSRLLLASGQILDTDTLTQSGSVGAGVSIFSSDGISAVVGESPTVTGIYNLATGQRTDTQNTFCKMAAVDRILEVQAGLEWILLGQHSICRVLASSSTDPAPSIADLGIDTVVSGDYVVGGRITYQLSVYNQGPILASNVRVVDTLPPGSGLVTASGIGWRCSGTAGSVNCVRGSLDVGLAETINIIVTLPSIPGAVSNVATVSSDTTDSYSANNTSVSGSVVATPATSVNLDLGADGFDVELDSARQRLYISVPDLNSIEVISLATFTVTNSIPVGGSPHGIDISPDGSTLYAALSQTGSVAIVNLDNLTITEVDVSTPLESLLAYDVISATPNEVFVSGGGPYGSGFAYIVKIDIGNGYQATRVAGGRIIRAAPMFVARANPQFLYVTEGFSPNSVYKLDLTQPDVPLVLEDNHGTILYGGSKHMAIEPDGSNIYMASGQIVRTDSLTQSGQIGRGVSAVGSDATSVLVGEAPNSIVSYDKSTYLQSSKVFTTCNTTAIDRILELQPGSEWIILGQQTACRVISP